MIKRLNEDWNNGKTASWDADCKTELHNRATSISTATETASPLFQETLSRFTVCVNHVVRFSDHEWSGTWIDITIETTLMREAKSSDGLIRGRFRNESSHKFWVQTLNHFSFIHQELKRKMVKSGVPVHRDFERAQMKRDNDAVNAIVGWLEEVNPFDATDKKALVSFSAALPTTKSTLIKQKKLADPYRMRWMGKLFWIQ